MSRLVMVGGCGDWPGGWLLVRPSAVGFSCRPLAKTALSSCFPIG